MAIVLMLFAIIGVTFFESDAPEEFGNLSRSIIVMFRIAGKVVCSPGFRGQESGISYSLYWWFVMLTWRLKNVICLCRLDEGTFASADGCAVGDTKLSALSNI